MMMKHFAAAATAVLMAVGFSPPANADLILTFGQSGSGATITGTGGLTGSTFSGTDIPVTITQIAAANPTPISAFLDINAANTTGAIQAGNLIAQNFAGTFSFNSLANNSGINYLSGTFADGALTADGSTAIAVFADEALFASDVIATLDLPRSVSFGLTNVQPPVSLTACTVGPTCGSGQTLAGYTASIAGNASAFTPQVPEPGTLGILGAGLIGTAFALRRRRRHDGADGMAAA